MAGGNIPSQLAPIFQQAGQRFGIPPAVLAGVSSVESDIFRNTGPSSTGAIGGMQFEPGTARGLGVNPNDPRSAIFGAARYLVQLGFHQNPLRAIGAYNGGPGNPQYGYANDVMREAARLAPQLHGALAGATVAAAVPGMGSAQPQAQSGPTFDRAGFERAQAGFLAGSFVKQTDAANPYAIKVPGEVQTSDPLLSSGLLSTQAPDPANYVGTVQQATGTLQQIAGSSLLNVHPGAKGYVNPIPGAVIGRTDMGVDANLKPGAPIRAIGDSKVLGIMPGWYAGQPYLALQLLSGPKAGQVYYVAEQINPKVRPGQTVKAGQPIATYAQSGTGIEIGWASPHNWQQTLAQATGQTGTADHSNAPAGVNFRSFLGGLGG